MVVKLVPALAKFVAPGSVGSCDAVGTGITPRKELVANGVVPEDYGGDQRQHFLFVPARSGHQRACSIVLVRCTDRLTVVV